MILFIFDFSMTPILRIGLILHTKETKPIVQP